MTGERAPPGWLAEPLTLFINEARKNQFATFHNKPSVVSDLCKLDRAFVASLLNLRGPDAEVLALLLFQRAHSAFRAAASLVLATQCAEAAPLLRVCLECAGYAALIRHDPARATTWLARDESDDKRKAVPKAFNSKTIVAALKPRDAEAAAIFSVLYENLIDFGAHPNSQMIISNLRIDRSGGEARLETAYLQADGLTLDLMLKWLVQVGIWVLHVFALLFPNRAADAKLDVELSAIKRRY